jgi:hypothetical protein
MLAMTVLSYPKGTEIVFSRGDGHNDMLHAIIGLKIGQIVLIRPRARLRYDVDGLQRALLSPL